MLVLSTKFLINGYKHSGTLFLGSSYHYLFKNIAHVRGICKFDPNCICVFLFVYLCICIVYLHVRDMETLFLRSSHHYLFKNIAHVRSICNFDRSCIYVSVYLHVRHLGTLFLRSLYHYLSENIWFVWSKTLHNGEKFRCHACDIHTDILTDTHRKVVQYSAEAESAKWFCFGMWRLPK